MTAYMDLLVMLCVLGAIGFAFQKDPGKPTPSQAANALPPGAVQDSHFRSGTLAVATPEKVLGWYLACISDSFPRAASATLRADACSRALQTRQLKPDQIALARLTRGVARSLLGNRELASDDYLEAMQHYDQLMDPGNPDVLKLHRRAAVLDASGHIDQALEDYTAAVKADPKSAFAFLGRGVLLAGRKRAYDRAIEDFDKVLALQPDNVDALIARGDASSNLGRAGRALVDLNRAVALAPDRPAAYLARGLAEARQGNNAAARRDYEHILRLDPDNVDALLSVAALESLAGQHEAAIAHLDAAIAVDPAQARAFYNRGYAHFALRRYEQALADYGAAIALNPTLGIAYNNRALVRAILGRDLVRALADSDQALKLQPLNLDIRETRGFIYLKLGDDALARHEYKLVLDVDPNRAVALYGRGLAKIRLGDSVGGQADQATAIMIYPAVAQDFSRYGL
jgi:tetratricopeptide (TPR) repeat protein